MKHIPRGIGHPIVLVVMIWCCILVSAFSIALAWMWQSGVKLP